jgi:hypothetical protein
VGNDYDPQYPYQGARLGTYGWDYATQKLIPPNSAYDLMSYCDPAWVSDHNYKAVQAFLESKPSVTAVPSSSGMGEMMLFSGRITDAGLVLSPVQRIFGAFSPPREGVYSLRYTANGQQHLVPFDVQAVADLVNEWHFSFTVPYSGDLETLEIVRGADVLLRKAAQPGRPTSVAVSAVDRGDRVEVRWDNRAYPYATVAHVDGDVRTTLALWLEGGQAELMTENLPRGGHYEVSLSDGLQSIRQVIARD